MQNINPTDVFNYLGMFAGYYAVSTYVFPIASNLLGTLAGRTVRLMPSNQFPFSLFFKKDSEIKAQPSTTYTRWKKLEEERRKAFQDLNLLKEFVLDNLGLIWRNEERLHTLLTKMNTYFNRRVQFRESDEWNIYLKQIWDDRKNLLYNSTSNYSDPNKLSLKKILVEMNRNLTNIDLLKEIAIGKVHDAQPKNENEAKQRYVRYLNYCKIEQESIGYLIWEINKDDSIASKLIPLIPHFNIAKEKSPFTRKQSLIDYFESQNIAGLPQGLENLVVTIAAAYDSAYKSSVTKLGLFPEKGLILHGPPGTGKTVMAKAIAEYLGCPDNQITITSGSNLLDKHVGDTEKSIRALFEGAKNDPENLHVIIIDEIDAILAKREQAQHSWETSRVTQFLTELDGINSPKNVFVIGITNHINRLDSAAIRPGRLGSLIEVPLPDEAQRKQIFDLYLRKIDRNFLSTDYSILTTQLAAAAKNFSGAEIRAAVQRTTNLAFMNIIRARHFKPDSEIQETPQVISVNDFLDSISLIKTRLVP